jgi:peptidoglycan-N-acetylglucosamine deacetylase
MVSAVRRRSSGYVYRRRRRGPRASVVFVLVALVAVLGIAAAVMAAQSGGGSGGGATDPANAATSHRHHHVRSSAAQRRRRLDSREIGAVLRYMPFVSIGARRHRVMALTFDDGPSPYTAPIVRTLARMHVPATFFVVGQQLTYFAAGLRDEVRHGFEVGDHTENHAWLAHLSAAGQYAQIHDDAARMQRAGAPAPDLFRPPYGIYNATTLRLLRGMRMLMVMWSIDPGDWRRPGTKAIVSGVLVNAKPGAIVILHDGGGDRTQTIAALPAIIHGLWRRGYRLVTVPQLIALDPPPRHQKLPQMGAA